MRASPPGIVLVADDEATLLRLITRVLERAGYQVIPAADGREALRSIEAQGDILSAAVLDATLEPGGIGPLLEALGRSAKQAGIVVTSGALLEPEAQALLDARGGRFVAKPFAPSGLLDALVAVGAHASA